MSTDNSNAHGAGQPITLEENEELQENDPNYPMTNANMIFENSIIASEFLRLPRPFLRPGSRAYSVPANMGKMKIVLFVMSFSFR